MIPKLIHYCWFGGNQLPASARRYIKGWKKYCPDYNIIEWNESNFDLDKYPYAREAYDAKKWAFVTDVVRLYALAEYGGIYMDTDVEVVKSLDTILPLEAVSGFESEEYVPTGLIASEKGQAIIAELLSEYENAHFLLSDGSYDLTTNVVRITRTLQKHGLVLNGELQTIDGFTLFPKDVFCAKDVVSRKVKKTKNTVTIHHFEGSWKDSKVRFHISAFGVLSQVLGLDNANRVLKLLQKLK